MYNRIYNHSRLLSIGNSYFLITRKNEYANMLFFIFFAVHNKDDDFEVSLSASFIESQDKPLNWCIIQRASQYSSDCGCEKLLTTNQFSQYSL